MKLKITATLSPENGTEEYRLAELNFIETKEGARMSFAIPESTILLPDSSKLTITACYSPLNSGASILVFHNAKQLALMLSPWIGANPYLGIQIDGVGFLHFYCERSEGE